MILIDQYWNADSIIIASYKEKKKSNELKLAYVWIFTTKYAGSANSTLYITIISNYRLHWNCEMALVSFGYLFFLILGPQCWPSALFFLLLKLSKVTWIARQLNLINRIGSEATQKLTNCSRKVTVQFLFLF